MKKPNVATPPQPRRTRAIAALVLLALGGALAVYVLFRGDSDEEAAYAQRRQAKAEEEQARFNAEMRQRDAIEQRALADENAREQQRRAQQEHDRIAARQAADDGVHAKDNAWNRFYTPSAFCRSKEGPDTMQCANEAARARKAFERKWDAGDIQ